MHFDLELVLRAIEVALIIANIGWFVFLSILQNRFASKKDVQTAHDHADASHQRLDVLDERLKGFPDYSVTNEIREDFARMRETQAATNTELRLLRETVQRMDDYLRNHSK